MGVDATEKRRAKHNTCSQINDANKKLVPSNVTYF